jgi:predicted DNA-binding transcriptional regulator AlpA
MNKAKNQNKLQLLRPKQVCKILGIGRTTLWKLSNEDPDFPPKIHLTPKAIGFKEADLKNWIETKAQAPFSGSTLHGK